MNFLRWNLESGLSGLMTNETDSLPVLTPLKFPVFLD